MSILPDEIEKTLEVLAGQCRKHDLYCAGAVGHPGDGETYQAVTVLRANSKHLRELILAMVSGWNRQAAMVSRKQINIHELFKDVRHSDDAFR